MCTPPRRDPVPTPQLHSARHAVVPTAAPKTVEAHCRWIDHSGLEWLFTRAGGSLIVERPNARGSVAISFPDLVGNPEARRAGEAWIVVEIEDGNVFHCGVSSAATLAAETTPPDPVPRWTGVNRSVRTWFEGAGPID